MRIPGVLQEYIEKNREEVVRMFGEHYEQDARFKCVVESVQRGTLPRLAIEACRYAEPGEVSEGWGGSARRKTPRQGW
ncbi:hypothetical protein COU20_00200 [Candidatus Kaiserbacteria bacterium CG10_big_fil_rev_8_21_14_0_10_59_10]|uniref:Uncharacterized protein n=1 Tax=Candidatus Kaiserbacteria bacterium CG10_big_fil_rev_8_21_14_0_10_59_10 TaxID=1974612 RepID=A0A2H0U8V3_9BACT|nr:MAG: hypothetical protein COU20_00200 [Candidatus Kaiserbacteria bacterium CG10_big_fil_rev_8_21_14_0_10_59_10]